MPRRAIQNKTPGNLGPGSFQANPSLSRHYRFSASSALTAVNIAQDSLFNAIGVIATSSTVGTAIAQSARVRRVEIWSPVASQGSATTCSVLFPSATQSPAMEFSDSTMNVSYPAHVNVRPPKDALCSFWVNDNNDIRLFTITAPAGSIVDVYVDVILRDASGASGTTAVLVGATVGDMYYCCLDSSTNASGKLKPVSLTVL